MKKSFADLYETTLRVLSVTFMAGAVLFMGEFLGLFEMSNDVGVAILLICGFTGVVIFMMTWVSLEKSWPEKPSGVQVGFSLMALGSSIVAFSVLFTAHGVLQVPKIVPFVGFIFFLLGFIACIWFTWAKPKNPAR